MFNELVVGASRGELDELHVGRVLVRAHLLKSSECGCETELKSEKTEREKWVVCVCVLC